MEYLVRFAQMHENFRKPEIDALAQLAGLHLQWIFYSDDVSRCSSALYYTIPIRKIPGDLLTRYSVSIRAHPFR